MNRLPTGRVEFKIGRIENLPGECEEIKLFMREGDPAIYIVPIDEYMSYDYVKVKRESSIIGDI